jgi:hypothetical protein
VARLILAATAVSTVEYPALYGDVVDCTWTGCALMLVRNGLLAYAAVLSFVRLWRSGRPLPQPQNPDAPAGKRDRTAVLSPTGG